MLGRFHSNHNSARSAVTRRGFVRNAALGSVATVLAGSAISFYQFFTPNKTGAFGGDINVSASQVPAVGAPPLKNAQGKFWLVQNDDGVLALYWKCVHLGCTVPWDANRSEFVCPCHGSVYDSNGVRISGPAPRPLDLMGVTIDSSGNVIVNTGEITIRGGYNPDQATPYSA